MTLLRNNMHLKVEILLKIFLVQQVFNEFKKKVERLFLFQTPGPLVSAVGPYQESKLQSFLHQNLFSETRYRLGSEFHVMLRISPGVSISCQNRIHSKKFRAFFDFLWLMVMFVFVFV